MFQNLFAHFSPNSKVWIYQSNIEFSPKILPDLETELSLFVNNWTAHNQALLAGFDIRYSRFIILMVDENKSKASGCSIDSSVHFLQKIESLYGLTLFDRMLFCFEKEGKIYCRSKKEFETLLHEGKINRETLVFNNLVKNKLELENDWRIPLKDSWMADYFSKPIKKETWS
jgi:hypothetical protein